MSSLSPTPALRLSGVRKTYREGEREREVLRGVDLELARGGLAVLLGRSGSGKSTLLNLIGGIDRPTAGRIEVDGVDVGALSERDRTLLRRDRMGLVFQFFNLIPTLTVEENLLLPLALQGRERERREAALALLDEVGLGDRRGEFPDRLSGGEQQRLAVARALAHDPVLVLADEPTGNLDAETGERVLDLLDRLTRRAGKTLLMATHSRHVASHADRVLEIEEGRLEELPRR